MFCQSSRSLNADTEPASLIAQSSSPTADGKDFTSGRLCGHDRSGPGNDGYSRASTQSPLKGDPGIGLNEKRKAGPKPFFQAGFKSSTVLRTPGSSKSEDNPGEVPGGAVCGAAAIRQNLSQAARGAIDPDEVRIGGACESADTFGTRDVGENGEGFCPAAINADYPLNWLW